MFETNSWTPLTDGQREFFTKQIDAGIQAAFSPTAHEAGLVTMHAERFSYRRDALTRGYGLVWPDVTSPGDHCAIVGSTQTTSLRGFMRICQEPASVAMEGIAVGLNSGTQALHGRQIVQRKDISSAFETLPTTSLTFLSSALTNAKKTNILPTFKGDFLQPQEPTLEIDGIDGRAVGRLYGSLTSLYANLFSPEVPKNQLLTRSTYDIAQALWKVAVQRAVESEGREGLVLHDEGGVLGTLFETESGISIIRRIADPNDAYAIASVKRPFGQDAELFAEQHTVSAYMTYADSTLLPAEMYNDPKALIGALPAFDADPRNEGESRDVTVRLEDKSLSVFQRGLTALLSNRVNTSA